MSAGCITRSDLRNLLRVSDAPMKTLFKFGILVPDADLTEQFGGNEPVYSHAAVQEFLAGAWRHLNDRPAPTLDELLAYGAENSTNPLMKPREVADALGADNNAVYRSITRDLGYFDLSVTGSGYRTMRVFTAHLEQLRKKLTELHGIPEWRSFVDRLPQDAQAEDVFSVAQVASIVGLALSRVRSPRFVRVSYVAAGQRRRRVGITRQSVLDYLRLTIVGCTPEQWIAMRFEYDFEPLVTMRDVLEYGPETDLVSLRTAVDSGRLPVLCIRGGKTRIPQHAARRWWQLSQPLPAADIAAFMGVSEDTARLWMLHKSLCNRHRGQCPNTFCVDEYIGRWGFGPSPFSAEHWRNWAQQAAPVAEAELARQLPGLTIPQAQQQFHGVVLPHPFGATPQMVFSGVDVNRYLKAQQIND